VLDDASFPGAVRCCVQPFRRRGAGPALHVQRTPAAILTDTHVSGTPEIGSPNTRKRDETIKRQLYERWGVSEYWVVDPEIDVVRVYRNESGPFERAMELASDAGDVLGTPLLPGLEVALARIFRGC